ncbi:ABC transporter substrate-binding protein [Piscinibacter sp.]|uniref:ABC transporter substrate-binding protein n=1 Tax=Piscinibacter sp. TaxID=1903157 RepID=UPI002C053AFD|nr:extracellular solute-binding protein [Albitalea sp.]HUG23441.1 extracellular solute-binding protein [Albitalea sp.]
MKRTLFAAAALASLAAHAQTTLTVAAFPAVDKIVKSAIPGFKKLHPTIDIKVVGREYADHHNAMVTSLATGTGLPDVMAVELGFLGRFAEGKTLTDLSKPPFNGLPHTTKFVPYTIPLSINSAGELSAIPTDIGPGTLFYRDDLLKKAGVTEKDLTASWESYVEAGKKIKAATGAYLLAGASDIQRIVIRTGLKSGEGVFFDKNNKALVDSPRFVRSFELAKQIRDAKLDANVGAWSNEWSEGFKRGTIATQMMGAWLGGHLQNWLAPNTRGLWRAADLPGGAYGSWGGTFYAIPKKSQNKEAAWEFIKYMTLNKDVQLAAFKAEDAFPALLEAQNDPFYEQGVEFFGGQKTRLLWRNAVPKIPAVEVAKHDSVAEEVIATELDKVLEQGKDIKTALADAKALIERRARR